MKKALVPTLAASLLLGIFTPLQSTWAATAVDPKASIVLTKVSDGTEHDTPNASFITSKNGYSVGDNTSTDGVVSSQDTVSYNLELKVQPGAARTFDVAFQLPSHLALSSDLLCSTNPYLKGTFTGTKENPVCTYEAQAGVPVTVQIPVTLKAKGTQGDIEKDQVLSATLARSGSEVFQTSSASPVTVVSAPAADLVVRPTQCDQYYTCYSTNVDNDLKGAFNFEVDALKFNSSTTKGSSDAGQWSAVVDVSAWPSGTRWWWNGSNISWGSNTTVTIPSSSGSGVLSFELNRSEIDKWAPGESRMLPIQVIPNKGAFATVGYQNFGKDWQPGQGKTASFQTSDVQGTGARKGFRYNNNDWSAWSAYRTAPEVGSVFGKNLWRPWSSSQTLWDQGNKVFGSQYSVPSDLSKVQAQVAEGTELKSVTYVNTQYTATTDPQDYTVVSAWDPILESVTGPVEVLDPSGNPLPESGYEVYWTTQQQDGSDITSSEGWVPARFPSASAKAAKIILKGIPQSGTYTVVVPLKLAESWGTSAALSSISDWSFTACTSCEGSEGISSRVQPVSKPTLSVKVNTSEYTYDSSYTQEYQPYVTLSGVESSSTPFSTSITIDLDACVTDLTVLDLNGWTVGPVTYGTGCGKGNGYQTSGKVTLTSPEFIPTMSLDYYQRIQQSSVYGPRLNLTYSPLSGVVYNYLTASVSKVGSSTTPTKGTSMFWEQYTPQTFVTQRASIKSSSVEVNTPITYRMEIVSGANSQSTTNLFLPFNGDSKLFQSVPNSSEYSGPKASQFSGGYDLIDVKVVDSSTTNPSQVEIRYSDDTADPNPYLRSFSSNTHSISIQGEGTITLDVTIQPRNGSASDIYMFWPQATRSENLWSGEKTEVSSWPVYAQTVSSKISGYVYWDGSGTGEPWSNYSSGIANIKVDLLDSSSKVVATTHTASSGGYSFEIPSGTYTIRIPALGASGGVPKTVKSAYSTKQLPVTQVFSHRNLKGTAAKPTIPVTIGLGSTLSGFNFGYAYQDPYVDLEKSPAKVSCQDSSLTCDVSWEVKIAGDYNNGAPTLTGGVLTDVASWPVFDMKLTSVPDDKVTCTSSTTCYNSYGWVSQGVPAGRIPGSSLVEGFTGLYKHSSGYYVNGKKVANLTDQVFGTGSNVFILTGTSFAHVDYSGNATPLPTPPETVLKAFRNTAFNSVPALSLIQTSSGIYAAFDSSTSWTKLGITGNLLYSSASYRSGLGYGYYITTSTGWWFVNPQLSIVSSTSYPGTFITYVGGIVQTSAGFFTYDGGAISGLSGTNLVISNTSTNLVGTSTGVFWATNSTTYTRRPTIAGTLLPNNIGYGLVATSDGFWVSADTTSPVKLTGITGTPKGWVKGSYSDKYWGAVETSSGVWFYNPSTKSTTKVDVPSGTTVLNSYRYNNYLVLLLTSGSRTWVSTASSSGVQLLEISSQLGNLPVLGSTLDSSNGSVATSEASYSLTYSGPSSTWSVTKRETFKTPPVAQTFSASSETLSLDNKFISRTFNLPPLNPTLPQTYRVDAKVSRTQVDQVIANQAYVSYSGLPRTAPAFPTVPSFVTEDQWKIGKLTGNSSCTATSLSTSGDQCDQVFSQVPKTTMQLSKVQGNLWLDAAKSGSLYSSAPKIANARVSLYQGTSYTDSVKVAETSTDTNGYYSFSAVLPASYWVQFEPPAQPTITVGGEDRTSTYLKPSTSLAWSKRTVATPSLNKAFNTDTGATRSAVPVASGATLSNMNGAMESFEVDSQTLIGSGPQLTNPAVVDYQSPVEVQSQSVNTSTDDLQNLVFKDSHISGPRVRWVSCQLGSETFPLSGDYVNNEFSAVLPSSWVLKVGSANKLVCSGTIDPLGDQATQQVTHSDKVSVQGIGVITGALTTSSATFTATQTPYTPPVPSITVEHGVLEGTNLLKTKQLEIGKPQRLTFRVKNTGQEPLLDLTVSDQILIGTGTVTNVVCDVPVQQVAGKPRSYLDVGSTTTCTADLVLGTTQHSDTATVYASGLTSKRLTTAESTFSATATWNPDIELPFSGGRGVLPFVMLAIALSGLSSWVLFRQGKK